MTMIEASFGRETGTCDAADGGARPATGARSAAVLVLAVGMVVVSVVSLAVGAKGIPVSTVVDALVSVEPGNADHLIVRELRVPRTITGLLVGASLAVAGALMQGLTRNPLADPGLLGVNAGAALGVVVAISWFGLASLTSLVWFAFVGAGAATVAVYLLGSAGRGGATPVRLALAGAAVAALLLSLTRAVTLVDQATLDRFRFWAVGSLSARSIDVVWQMAPFVAIGLVVAAGVARPLDTLALGDDTARGLGTRLGAVRGATWLAVTLLCGASVAAAGPIGFVGLVVPHAMRAIVGPSQRWLVATSALAGATLVVGCDTLGRVIARPGEVEVGIVTAAIGGPAFVALVRRTRMAEL